MNRAFEGPAKVRDLMTADVATVGAQESIGFALELMLWRAVHHLPVMDDSKLVGVISDRDLIARPATEGVLGMRSIKVSEVMTKELEVTHPEDDAALASARMVDRAIHCLLVVEDEELVGIVTSTDVLAERGRLFLKAGKAEVPGAGTLMTADPVHVVVTDSLAVGVKRMSENGVRHLPVVDAGGRVVGMLSERNLRAALGLAAVRAGAGLGETTVEKVMTCPPTVCRRDASLFELTNHFVDERIGAVAVVDGDDRLLGIVSYVDLLRYLLGDGST